MIDTEEEKDFTDILEELAGEELLEYKSDTHEIEKVTDENVNEFILKYASKLVVDGTDAITKIQSKIVGAQDSDEIKALGDLTRAVNSTLDTLTKISLQNKKEKSATAVKQLEHTNRKELPDTPKTQIIVGTREDIFKQILAEEKEATGIEVIEENE